MKVKIDLDRCVGHGICRAFLPEVFDIDAMTGQSVVRLSDIPEQLRERVKQAALSCPEEAIAVVE
jgi:ferredoxin